MSTRSRAPKNVVAASPPLIPGCAAQGTGPFLRPQGCCASLTRRPCGPALTPETSADPQGQQARAGHACPGRARGAQAAYHQIGSLYSSRGLPVGSGLSFFFVTSSSVAVITAPFPPGHHARRDRAGNTVRSALSHFRW